MLPRIPRRRFDSVSSGESRPPPSSFTPSPAYSHVSTYRTLQMEMQVHSPSVKNVEDDTEDRFPTSLPVYGDNDQVRGRVILDPSCSATGRLTISVQGYFLYDPPASRDSPHPLPTRQKHTFLSSSTTISVSPTLEAPPRSAFRDAFSTSIRRRPSASSLTSTATSLDRSYSFSFELPRGQRLGEEMPPTCSSNKVTQSPGRLTPTGHEIEYTVSASWEPSSGYESPSRLETPIVFHPERDFQSLDASSGQHDSWLEMPLRSDRPMPFRCAVTLPSSVTFSRGTSIPFFVVFTTTPRSSTLAKEIAADATISVSLIRQTTIQEVPLQLPTPPHTPTSSVDENEPPRSAKLLKRVVTVKSGSSRSLSRSPSSPTLSVDTELRDKPLPRLPHSALAASETLLSMMCIGFPKRPRNPCDSSSHPPLAAHNMLPDGLHKSKIPLKQPMMPSIDWGTICVKYYLDVSVSFGQDDLRARIPIKIT
ncbi:hypothetical protein HGRIS_011731 [Hohenbuehelia grisea]|uniref:Uncharacterized protein n=1 Tax=Hohenbuehelia grisea TaxID=104357 RepID=A0ABR3JY99_9AGAR